MTFLCFISREFNFLSDTDRSTFNIDFGHWDYIKKQEQKLVETKDAIEFISSFV